MLTLGILFAIVAMIGWGIADFVAAKAVRKITVIKTFLWSQSIGLVFFLIIFALFFKFPSIPFPTLILISISSLIIVIAGLAFYKGLQVGYVSIISPISSASAVITVILSLIFLNETLTRVQAIGVTLAILGAILTSFKFHDLIKLKLKNIATGVEYALITMFGWGVMVILIDILVSELGWFFPIFLLKVFVVFYVLMYSGITKKNISFPRNALLLVILAGILESGAFLLFGAGLTYENTSIIAPIVSAFPIVAIILARIFFKEILELNQKLGVVTVILGVVLLSI
ncbi:hypothetical protein CMO87_01800 [Candidatus Woesearchaeota archaeon]|nr:hypothetical protein [Candidatus Woesearchaeota archaeon]